jgi:uncharacterized phage-associated protein
MGGVDNMATVFDVAKYILEKQGVISVWKLQKLCYYAQAWQLAWTDGQPLFAEDFQAWPDGPVCRELYNAHEGKYTIAAGEIEQGDSTNLTEDEFDSIDVVLRDYGDKPLTWLREQSHIEDPWKMARGWIDEDACSEEVITKNSMGAYYGSL